MGPKHAQPNTMGIVLVGTTTVGVGTKAPQWAQVAKPGKNQPNWQPDLSASKMLHRIDPDRPP